MDPNNADAHYLLGMAMVNGGDTAGAKPELETYLKLAPNGVNATTAKAFLASIK
jgi:Flp pilus assembly protein TadD